MKWEEVRAEYPNKWPVVEAIRFHEEGDDLMVVEKCPGGAAAFAAYRRLHRVYPAREFLFVHTSRPDLRVEERRWLGVKARMVFSGQVDAIALDGYENA